MTEFKAQMLICSIISWIAVVILITVVPEALLLIGLISAIGITVSTTYFMISTSVELEDEQNSVTITTEDFATSLYTNPWDCSLAKALKRKFPGSEVAVGSKCFDIDFKTFCCEQKIADEIERRTGKSDQEPLTVVFTDALK